MVGLKKVKIEKFKIFKFIENFCFFGWEIYFHLSLLLIEKENFNWLNRKILRKHRREVNSLFLLAFFWILDLCSAHSSTVAAGALVVFLRFLLDRGPWPEYYLADQPVVVYGIAAEEKFRQFSYGRWVRDSFILSIRHVRPPEIGWSPDLFAYFLLLCIILGGFVFIHFCYKPKTKQFYYFSYKKL